MNIHEMIFFTTSECNASIQGLIIYIVGKRIIYRKHCMISIASKITLNMNI